MDKGVAFVSQLVKRCVSIGYEAPFAIHVLQIASIVGLFGSWFFGMLDQKLGTRKATMIFSVAIAVLFMAGSENGLELKDRNKIFDSGYLSDEMGVTHLKSGGYCFANHTKIENGTGEMLQWWFAWHPLDNVFEIQPVRIQGIIMKSISQMKPEKNYWIQRYQI